MASLWICCLLYAIAGNFGLKLAEYFVPCCQLVVNLVHSCDALNVMWNSGWRASILGLEGSHADWWVVDDVILKFCHGRSGYHLLGRWWARHLKYCSTHLLTTSDCLSVCVWYEKLNFNSVPDNLKNSFQKWLINMEFWSLTIERGMSGNLTTPSTNFSTTILAMWGGDGRGKGTRPENELIC